MPWVSLILNQTFGVIRTCSTNSARQLYTGRMCGKGYKINGNVCNSSYKYHSKHDTHFNEPAVFSPTVLLPVNNKFAQSLMLFAKDGSIGSSFLFKKKNLFRYQSAIVADVLDAFTIWGGGGRGGEGEIDQNTLKFFINCFRIKNNDYFIQREETWRARLY